MQISRFLRQCPGDITLADFCQGVTQHIRRRYPPRLIPMLEATPHCRMAASCIVYSRHHNQIWMIGDCQCLIGNSLYENPKPHEDRLAAIRAHINSQLLAKGTTVESLQTTDLGRQHIIPEMIATMKRQNIDYAVVDGFPIPLDKVRVIPLPATPSMVVLASDGYPFLHPTLSLCEQSLLEQKLSDPLNIGRFKATKAFTIGSNSFDDRTFVSFYTAPYPVLSDKNNINA